MQFVVDFKNSTTQQDIEAYLAANELTVVKDFNNFEKVFVVTGNVFPEFTEIIEHLVNDDEHHISLLSTTIISNQSYGKKTLSGEVVTIENTQDNWWKSYTVMSADLESQYFSIDRRGNNSTVYILDSGIEINHTEFANRKVSNLWSFNNDFTDKNGHGTAIASVIVGNTTGVTDTNVKSVKIFDPKNPTKQSAMLNALDIVFEDIINNKDDFAIVNCSWTISKNTLIENKMRVMIENGIFIVAAAGNSGLAIDNVTPASMPEVLTIGAYNSNLLPCDFSNYTSSLISNTPNSTNHGELDGWAPGEDIYVAGLNQTHGLVSGTSIAAGIVSAAIAYNVSYITSEFTKGRILKEYHRYFSLARTDLLDLSNPKYRNSNNLIAGIYSQLNSWEGKRNKTQLLIRATSGQYISYNLFNPTLTEKIEIFGTLPECYRITETGHFLGKMPTIIDNYTFTKIPVKLTYTDGTIMEDDLEIINIRNDYDVSQSTGDAVLDIKLQDVVNCGFNQYYPACTDFRHHDPTTDPPGDDYFCIDSCGWYGANYVCHEFRNKLLCQLDPYGTGCFCVWSSGEG
jgi:hypothetical protein